MLDQDEAISEQTSGSYNGGPRFTLPERDVRRKRPPVIKLLLRLETLRRLVRVSTLLLIDFVGVVASLLTAMALKLALLGSFTVRGAWGDVHQWIPFAYLVTVLMFARVDLYADRPRRPGLARIASALFQGTVIALVFALANGKHFSSYYIFYGSLFFGVAYLTGLRSMLHADHRPAARAGRLPPAGDRGRLGRPHRRRGPRAGRADPLSRRCRRLRVARAPARERPTVAR